MVALHPYQEEARDLIVARKQVLLAYSMGLGKSPITIFSVEELMATGDITSPVLVVALSSLKYQWQKEIAKFAPESVAVVVDGTPAKRKEQYARIKNWEEDQLDYVVANYEQVTRDWEFFGNFTWGAVVADEATALKSFRSKRATAMKKLAKDVPVRIALTGTPMENGKPEEIFSIMEFVDPTVLGRFDMFDKTFIVRNRSGWVERYRNLPTLHKALAPASVRKKQTDPDVAPYLPDVIDMPPIEVQWDNGGWDLYQTISRDLLLTLDEATEMFGSSWSFNVAAHYGHKSDNNFDAMEFELRGRIMTRIQALRMMCVAPELIRISAQKFASRIVGDEIIDGSGSEYAYLLQQEGHLDRKLGTPKLDMVAGYLNEFLALDDRNKAVIFSSFVDTLPMIASSIKEASVLFHGGMSAKQKEAAKEQFQQDPETRVLISSDAGGFGVDLPQANLLVNVDLPWTSGAALQRNSRIIRASSTWPSVRLDRFLMSQSLELRQWEALTHKSAVAAAVMDGTGYDDKGGVTTSVSSLRDVISVIFD